MNLKTKCITQQKKRPKIMPKEGVRTIYTHTKEIQTTYFTIFLMGWKKNLNKFPPILGVRTIHRCTLYTWHSGKDTSQPTSLLILFKVILVIQDRYFKNNTSKSSTFCFIYKTPINYKLQLHMQSNLIHNQRQGASYYFAMSPTTITKYNTECYYPKH